MVIVKVVKVVFVFLIFVYYFISWIFFVEDVDVYKNIFYFYNNVKN